MKIGVLSDCRMPTVREGGHGLGMTAWDIAEHLLDAKHDVRLYAGPGSEHNAPVVVHADEVARARDLVDVDVDVWIDLSHYHELSRIAPELPVINYMMDTECQYKPPNAVVANKFGQDLYGGRVVKLGVRMGAFYHDPSDYLAFSGAMIPRKGFDKAMRVAMRTGKTVRFAGRAVIHREGDLQNLIPTWMGEIPDRAQFERFVGNASVLLNPSVLDSGGRVSLDAAMCGTPTLVFDVTGAQYHVEHGVSGYVVQDVEEMADAVRDAIRLDRERVREWAVDNHSIYGMCSGLIEAAQAVIDGERW